jgi:hypothetical protein
MKRIITLLLLAVGFSASAQHTSTRQVYNGVQDASVLSYVTKAITDTAGSTTDTLELRPNAAVSVYNYSAIDSSALRLKSLAGCYKGDILELYVTKGSGSGKVYFTGNWVLTSAATSISLAASKKTLIRFEFDGVSWVEITRQANY